MEEGQSLKALFEIRKDSPRHCHTLFTVLFCQLIPSSRLKINARERLLFHFTGKLANKKKKNREVPEIKSIVYCHSDFGG